MKIDLIKEIHATNTKIVLAIAGGGSEVIGELLRHGQGSNTLLEAIVPYCQRAYEEFIGGTPDKFVSEEAAAQLAMASWQRACHLQDDNVVGIGVTCSLAKENERTGREHKVWIARQSIDKCITLGFSINASREEEETFVADVVLGEVAAACGLERRNCFEYDAGITVQIPTPPSIMPCCNIYEVPKNIGYIYKRQTPASVAATNEFILRKLILPGSFNPPHAGHILMAKIARELCPAHWHSGDKVNFELSVRNVDKPWLTYKAINERSKNFNNIKNNSPHKEHLGDLLFTNAPLFFEKAKIFSDCVFIVGYDTFSRIYDSKYYQSPTDMEIKLRSLANVKWIVFPRKKADGTISTKEDVVFIPNLSIDTLRNVFIVPNELYPEEIHNVSSTAIRNNQ